MRKLWIMCGFALGGLFVWSLTHEAREMLRKRKAKRPNQAFMNELNMSLARMSALHGVDYTSDAYWEQELAQYKDVYDAWNRGDFSEYPLD